MRTFTRLPLLLTLPALVALAGCAIDGTEDYERPVFSAGGGGGGYQPAAPTPVARSFTILHTNDEHSHLLGFGPNLEYPYLPAPGETGDGVATTVAIATAIGTGADQKTVGGFARRDYLMNKLRSEATDPVIAVSAGDHLMGTLFHVASTQGAPDYLAMYLAGYDYMTIGNHEFDFGADFLGATYRTASNLTFGAMPKVISSNINFDDVTAKGAGALLQSQYGPGGSGAIIQPWDIKVLSNGLRVGIMGALGYTPAFLAPGKSPVAFSVPLDGAACTTSATCTGLEQCVRSHCVDPLDSAAHIGALAADLQATADTLRNEQMVDVVVLVSHMGTVEELAIAGLTTGIDVIIGGHSHDFLPASVVEGTSTILASARSYGRVLGELTVTVDPDGTVAIDDTRTALHNVDYTLDAEIVAGTSLPTTVSPALERAVSITLAVVAPTVEGLNGLLVDVFNVLMPWRTWTSIFDVVATNANGPIFGGAQFEDHNLLHLVTDADHAIISANSCIPPTSLATIAVQANGVIRDSLNFTTVGNATSVADVFRVLPLGASPYEDSSVAGPGYPLMQFQLLAIEMLAGFEVGVTNGLESDDFFLSYAGAQIEYDTSRPPFDQTDLQNSGLITKISIGDDLAGYNWDIYDASRPLATRWRESDNTTPFDPTANLVTVITNFYIGGFLEAFGLAPRDAFGAVMGLDDAVICWAGQAPNCAVGLNMIMPCKLASKGTVPWAVPEVKEWQVLITYLNSPLALNGVIPPLYVGDTPAVNRVVDVTAP